MHTTTGMSSSSAMRCRRRATQQRGSRAISTRRRRGRGSVQTTIRRRIPKRRAMLANLQESDLQRRHAMRRKRRSSRAGISRKGAASLALTVSLATTSSRKNLRQRQQQQKPGRLPIKRLRRLPISSRRMERPGSVIGRTESFTNTRSALSAWRPAIRGTQRKTALRGSLGRNTAANAVVQSHREAARGRCEMGSNRRAHTRSIPGDKMNHQRTESHKIRRWANNSICGARCE